MHPTPALPFWGRVTVVESPADEEQTPGGLIVPASAFASGEKEDGDPARRGIVQAVDADIWAENSLERACADRIVPGAVVFFRNPKRLPGGLLVVDLGDIIAYEPEPS